MQLVSGEPVACSTTAKYSPQQQHKLTSQLASHTSRLVSRLLGDAGSGSMVFADTVSPSVPPSCCCSRPGPAIRWPTLNSTSPIPVPFAGQLMIVVAAVNVCQRNVLITTVKCNVAVLL